MNLLFHTSATNRSQEVYNVTQFSGRMLLTMTRLPGPEEGRNLRRLWRKSGVPGIGVSGKDSLIQALILDYWR